MITKNALFRDHILSDRERKNLTILDIIRRKGSVSRTDISRLSGFNIVTVSNYIDNYLKLNMVFERGCNVSSGGRKPTLVELNYKAFYVAGVDIGPDKIVAVITDLAGNIVAKAKSDRPKGLMEEVVNKAIDVAHKLINDSKIAAEKIKGIGLGISGVIDKGAGTVRDTDPARGATSTSYAGIRGRVEREFAIPVYVGNDATVAAYAEAHLGMDQDIENLVYLYADVGCGIIIKGDIYTGTGGSAGEVQVNFENAELTDKFSCVLKGPCFLRPWGGIDSGITSEAKKRIKQGAKSQILDYANGDIEKITLEAVVRAAKADDKLATELIDNAAVNLSVRTAYFINLLNPEVVVIGGGIEQAGELLISRIRKAVKGLAFEEPASMAKVTPSRLGEWNVSLGAALLVMREVFAEL